MYRCRNNHWITASTIGCEIGIVNIHDSLYTDIAQLTRSKVEETFPDLKRKIIVLLVQKQFGVKDCGLFSLRFATYIAFVNSPESLSVHQFNQKKLREHYLSCLMKQVCQFQ